MLKNEPGFTRGEVELRVFFQNNTTEYRPVQALLVGGLAVHHKLSDDYHGMDVHEIKTLWTVSHVQSGLRIHKRALVLTRRQAIEICKRCLPLTDWSQDEVTIRASTFDIGLVEQVDAIVQEVLA